MAASKILHSERHQLASSHQKMARAVPSHKHFLKNAVLTQIWVAMIYFLLLKWVAHCINFKKSLTEMARKLAATCMHRFQLLEVLCCTTKGLQRLHRTREGPQTSIF